MFSYCNNGIEVTFVVIWRYINKLNGSEYYMLYILHSFCIQSTLDNILFEVPMVCFSMFSGSSEEVK